MAQSKNIGHGASLSRQTGTPTTIGQVRVITPPTISREDVDATTLDDGVMYFLPSDPEDPGELSCELLWTPGETNDELIDTDFNARTIASWRITYPTVINRTATFSAWVKSIAPAPLESRETVKRIVTFRLTTAITWAAAS